MMTVPIVFAIDQNVVMQCGVTMTSLFLNAGKDTFYDVYILHDKSKLGVDSQQRLQKAFPSRDRYRISFVDVGNTFSDSEGLATGHITTATYFRLAIPALFPQFDKVIYSDIDIVFQQDLSRLYTDSLQQGELLAAALDLSIDREHYFNSKMVTSIGKSASDYFNAGFLVMNLAEMRKGDFLSQVAKHSKIKYEQNDQDVLNILCNGRVQYLPSAYNFQPSHYAGYMWRRFRPVFQAGNLALYRAGETLEFLVLCRIGCLVALLPAVSFF